MNESPRETPAVVRHRHKVRPPPSGRNPPGATVGRKEYLPSEGQDPRPAPRLRAGPHPTVGEAEAALRASGVPSRRRPQQPPNGPTQHHPARNRRHVPGAEGAQRRPRPSAPAQERPPRLPGARLSRRRSGWRSRGADPARAGRASHPRARPSPSPPLGDSACPYSVSPVSSRGRDARSY